MCAVRYAAARGQTAMETPISTPTPSHKRLERMKRRTKGSTDASSCEGNLPPVAPSGAMRRSQDSRVGARVSREGSVRPRGRSDYTSDAATPALKRTRLACSNA
jgi:hypothetical protein